MIKILLFLIAYFTIPPLILFFGRMSKEKMKQQMMGRKRSATALRADSMKEGFNAKLSKRIKFTMKDPRKKPIPYKMTFYGIYLGGAAVAGLAGFLLSWKLMLASLVMAYISFIFSYATSDKLIRQRDETLKRMLEVKGSKMRFMQRDKGVPPSPASEFRVLEWNEDLTFPTRLHLYMPTDFDILEVDKFLESFNLVFGSNGQWISDDEDEQYGGFDFNAGVAAIRVSTPLPKRADWHERYLNEKDIHWSFFPLALGSENGVPVFNEELQKTERVLGFAVNGGQEKLSAKNGVVIGKEVTSSPQALIAGGTGGGKALSSKTSINRIKDC